MKKLFILIIAAMVAAGVSAADGNAGMKKELRVNFRHKIGLGVGLGLPCFFDGLHRLCLHCCGTLEVHNAGVKLIRGFRLRSWWN